MENVKLLTVREMAEALHIKENTMQSRRWQVKSRCPLFKRGRRLFAFDYEFWKWFRNGPQFSFTDTDGGAK